MPGAGGLHLGLGLGHYVSGPAYGAQKAGQDKFAADMAVDFMPFNVAAVSIWMGPSDRPAAIRIAAAPEFADIDEISRRRN